ncbi:MAG: MCE family protein [Rhodanobacter sp.]|jgi:paraquat-inducible protein B|nr:MCE family protein [Rhodanobacter sp.]MBN8946260.1 MCE family protein [Rhodanobacter sp.]ODT90277.1 MAG: mammalian cell entry protein [Rhodanobacter sp. SCN 67-45]OJW44470.1 MAG: mammalian cell entry protein [Rhodanobacter sp. 67-28]
MTEDTRVEPGPPAPDALPRPVVEQRRFKESLIWLVPALAALVGLSLVIHNWLQTGPQVVISLQSAEGLDAGKTPVKYKNVVIGRVKKIRLSPDRSHVLVSVALEKSAEGFATKGTRYWVVRPRIGLGGVSGIDTLFSGAFIGADVGESDEQQEHFDGLEAPPAVRHGELGRSFVLHSEDLGSLDVGSPVYYRRIQVGRVASYTLDKDGKGVSLHVFIDGPNDRFVSRSSRFWNASGVDLSLGANGLKLNTQSMAAVLAGGVAFQDPPGPHDSTPAPEDTSFKLFGDRTTAMAPPDGEPHYLRMRFEQSVRGLAVDAPVEFLGINIGKVVSVRLDYDEKTQKFPVLVGAVVYPERLGAAYDKLEAMARANGHAPDLARMMGGLIAHGLRAQARTGNLLTGQLYVALDFVPHATKVDFDPAAKPLTIPTAPGSFDKLQEQLAEIVDKLDKVPFDSIGKHVDQVLAGLDTTLKQVNGKTLPAFTETLHGVQKTMGTADAALSDDSPLQRNLGATLEQVQRMSRSLRVLSDYLSGHPEALLRGRRPDDRPATPPAPEPAPAQEHKP